MLAPKTKRNIYRVIPFGVIWLIFSLVYTLLEKGLLAELNHYPSTGNPYSFGLNIFITPVSALIVGLLTGTLEILYVSKLFIQQSFGKKILYKSLIYLAIIALFLAMTSVIAGSLERGTIFHKEVWSNLKLFLSDYSFLSVAIYMSAIIVVTQFYTEVSENIGQAALTNFFVGTYNTPQQEERIFMFLDMRSSTTIAETLGSVRYFEMLKQYYSDLSDPIIMYSGEIYQYAGDEIIVSWTLRNGLKNSNCIQCFLAMKEAMQQQAGKYKEEFGLVPTFKAGFHTGKVTTGEIGIIKKEIFFTGDVINTAARIQGLCNTYGVDILISGELMEKLSPGSPFQLKALGENELRGRDEKVKLFTLV